MNTKMKPDEFSNYASSVALAITLIQSGNQCKGTIAKGIEEGIELCKAIRIGSDLSKLNFCAKELDFKFKVRSYTKRIPNLIEYFEGACIIQNNLEFMLNSSTAPNPQVLNQYLDYFDHIAKATRYLDCVDKLSE